MKFGFLMLWVAVTANAACVALPPRERADAQAQSSEVRVYRVAEGVTAPQLMPMTFPTAECENPLSGEVKVAAVVDVSGKPRNVMFTKPLGNAVDKLALNILEADRFKPGNQDGSPVPVAQTITIKLDVCAIAAPQDAGKGSFELKPHSQPEQHLSDDDSFPATVIYAADVPVTSANTKPGLYHVGGDVSAPEMLFGVSSIDVGKGETDTRAKYQGQVMLSVVVDSQGMPHDVRVVRPLGMGLDQKAIDAVERFRFRPAILKRKQPVPVMVVIQFTFRIFSDLTKK
jgi:TonB family protein